jgi:hypothetical protein
MKASTGGLNTNRFQGRNCHIHPFPDQKHLGGMAAIALDGRTRLHGTDYMVVDLLMSVLNKEHWTQRLPSDLILTPTKLK